MDVAKYIALFLLKHKYCHLQALGNLEIRKSSSLNNGKDLTGRIFVAKLDPVGAIDDQLPLFIAIQEKISVARASAMVNDFVTHSKSQLQSGAKVAIPGIGKYSMKSGKIQFDLDNYFSLPEQNIPLSFFNSTAPILTATDSEPANAQAQEEAIPQTYQQYNNYNTPAKINWNAIAFWGLAILVVLSIIAGVLKYTVFKDEPQESLMIPEEHALRVDSTSLLTPAMIDSNVHAGDSVSKADSLSDSTAAPDKIPAATTPGAYRFIIKKYRSLSQAEKKSKRLISYGYPVTVISVNDTLHYVIDELKIPASDTTKMKDSFTRWLNPTEGVKIMR